MSEQTLAELFSKDQPTTKPTPGLVCPRCGCGHFEVVYVTKRPSLIQRRRQCRNCGKRITTYEKVVAR